MLNKKEFGALKAIYKNAEKGRREAGDDIKSGLTFMSIIDLIRIFFPNVPAPTENELLSWRERDFGEGE
jgi:hypothetical protein